MEVQRRKRREVKGHLLLFANMHSIDDAWTVKLHVYYSTLQKKKTKK